MTYFKTIVDTFELSGIQSVVQLKEIQRSLRDVELDQPRTSDPLLMPIITTGTVNEYPPSDSDEIVTFQNQSGNTVFPNDQKDGDPTSFGSSTSSFDDTELQPRPDMTNSTESTVEEQSNDKLKQQRVLTPEEPKFVSSVHTAYNKKGPTSYFQFINNEMIKLTKKQARKIIDEEQALYFEKPKPILPIQQIVEEQPTIVVLKQQPIVNVVEDEKIKQIIGDSSENTDEEFEESDEKDDSIEVEEKVFPQPIEDKILDQILSSEDDHPQQPEPIPLKLYQQHFNLSTILFQTPLN